MGFGLALALVAQPLSSTAKGDESLCNSDSETRHFSVAEGHLQVTIMIIIIIIVITVIVVIILIIAILIVIKL